MKILRWHLAQNGSLGNVIPTLSPNSRVELIAAGVLVPRRQSAPASLFWAMYPLPSVQPPLIYFCSLSFTWQTCPFPSQRPAWPQASHSARIEPPARESHTPYSRFQASGEGRPLPYPAPVNNLERSSEDRATGGHGLQAASDDRDMGKV